MRHEGGELRYEGGRVREKGVRMMEEGREKWAEVERSSVNEEGRVQIWIQ